MKSRPILFKAEMVRAILDGKKTQTRRIMKNKPGPSNNASIVKCPFGSVGDQLWVKEKFICYGRWEWYFNAAHNKLQRRFIDETSTENPVILGDYIYMLPVDEEVSAYRKRSSLFMPKKYSRITLEITGIRAERLQDISEEDAIAEGVDLASEQADIAQNILDNLGVVDGASCSIYKHSIPLHLFRELWNKINFQRGFGWSKNPWVLVVKFRRISDGNSNDSSTR